MAQAEIPFSVQLLNWPFLEDKLNHGGEAFWAKWCGLARLTIWKGGQGSCIFNSCIEKGISAGLICIYGEPGEIPSSLQQLELQELY